MKKFCRALLILLALSGLSGLSGLSALYGLPPCAGALAAAPSEWVITNRHIGTGDYIYYLSENAMRIESTGNGGVVVARAPEWRVSCSRPAEKLEYSTPLKDFDCSRIFSFMPKHVPGSVTLDRKYVQAETLKGLKVKRYTFPDGKQFWAVADFRGAPQVSELISRYFNNVDAGCVPIKIINGGTPSAPRKPDVNEKVLGQAVPWMNFKNFHFEPNGRLAIDLISWKKVPYNDADFQYPKGFKQTRDIKDVIISEGNRKEIMELVDTLGPRKGSGSK